MSTPPPPDIKPKRFRVMMPLPQLLNLQYPFGGLGIKMQDIAIFHVECIITDQQLMMIKSQNDEIWRLLCMGNPHLEDFQVLTVDRQTANRILAPGNG